MEVAIIVGVVFLALGIGVTYALLAGKSTSKLKLADQQVENARGEAERITSEANRQAENAKKEAVLEAKEQILQLKQNSEAEEKKRKGELQTLTSSWPSRPPSSSASPASPRTTPTTSSSPASAPRA